RLSFARLAPQWGQGKISLTRLLSSSTASSKKNDLACTYWTTKNLTPYRVFDPPQWGRLPAGLPYFRPHLKPQVLLRTARQSRLHRIVRDILQDITVFPLITDNPIIGLRLPD